MTTDVGRPRLSLQSRIGRQLVLQGGSRSSVVQKGERRGVFYILPFLLAFGLFLVTPVGYAVYTSLYTTKMIGGTAFSGFSNYTATFNSSEFWQGVWRVALFALIQVPVTLVLACFFAAMFDLGIAKFGRFFRTVFFMPFAVPAVAAAVMWSFLLAPSFGPVSRLASVMGFSHTNFFGPSLVLPTIIVIVIWEWTGYNMIILYTAMKAVPKDVIEAAVIEGAGLWRVLLRVKVPMVRPALIMLVFLNLVGALQLFTEPMMIASFQPQAVSFGFTPVLYIYNTAIGSTEYNLGAAAAVVFAVVIALISLGSFLFRLRGRGAA